ncbi:MAG: hypothetical protein ACXWTW_05185, partial [Methylobacter sp.]
PPFVFKLLVSVFISCATQKLKAIIARWKIFATAQRIKENLNFIKTKDCTDNLPNCYTGIAYSKLKIELLSWVLMLLKGLRQSENSCNAVTKHKIRLSHNPHVM